MKKQNVHFSSNSAEWSTPESFFVTLNDEFDFTLDPCSTHENAKCIKHYTKVEDGLSKDWREERVFCNPPYGRVIGEWVKKCSEGGQKYVSRYFLRGQTRDGFTHIYMVKQKYVSFVDVLNSVVIKIQHHFRA